MARSRQRPQVQLRLPPGDIGAVAVVLHGGKGRSHRAPQPWQAAVVRMAPIARAISRAGAPHGVAVATVLHRYRGWNGPEMSPVADARCALDIVRERCGDVPVVLVGHSMGGRTALHCADDPNVIGVVALAPWIEPGEPIAQLAGRQLVVLHGDRDRWTDPRASRVYVEQAATFTRAARIEMVGEGHSMLRRASLWHALAAGSVLAELGFTPQSDSGPDANTAQEALHRVAAGHVLLSV